MQRFINMIFSRLIRISRPLEIRYCSKFAKDRLLALIILKLHSVEKGLSIESPRLGFGILPITTLFEYIRSYQFKGFDMQATPILMAYDAIADYLNFHDQKNFTNDFIVKIQAEQLWLSNYVAPHDKKLGGTLKIHKSELDFDLDNIRKLFMTRHSVRNFANADIDEDTLRNAIELAMRAPSACNRQAVRVYIIGKNKFSLLKDYLKGVGGFEDSLNKMIIITGKMSSYSKKENYQYIVSASIFAGYLSLSLHALGIGCCMIQRPLQYQQQWGSIAGKLGIPDDEQIICMAGLGLLKDSFDVPVSARLSVNEIAKFI